MADTAAECRKRAEHERAIADGAELKNVRTVHSIAAVRWEQMAQMAEVVERARQVRERHVQVDLA